MTLIRFALLIAATLLGTDPASTPRVRSTHPYIRAMIAEAQVRSATFRTLIERIEATDGIVYVEEGDCHYPVPACLPPVVTTAGGFRFLRVIVDARREDWQVMSDIGHELQHALEVLVHTDARTDATLVHIALANGSGNDAGAIRETRAAVEIGELVKKDLATFARDRATKALPRAGLRVGIQTPISDSAPTPRSE